MTWSFVLAANLVAACAAQHAWSLSRLAYHTEHAWRPGCGVPPEADGSRLHAKRDEMRRRIDARWPALAGMWP